MIKNLRRKTYPRYNNGSYPNTRNSQNNNDSTNNHNTPSPPPSPHANNNQPDPPLHDNANHSHDSTPFKSVSNNLTKKEARTILGVNNLATKREITLRYRILSRKYHPDKWTPDLKYSIDICTERFKIIANARDKLLDED